MAIASQRGIQLPPEPVAKMTSGKRTLLLSLALIFDAVKFMCTQLWFFGPAIIALAGSAFVGGGWFGTAVGAVLGIGTAATVGAAIEMIGIILALAVGFGGWIIILAIMYGWRIDPFHARNFMTMVVGMLVSEVPFVDALPSFTITVWRVVQSERKADREARQKWEADNAALIKQQQRAGRIQEKQVLALEDAQDQQAAEDQAAAVAQEEADAAAAQEAERVATDVSNIRSYERTPPAPLVGPPSLNPR